MKYDLLRSLFSVLIPILLSPCCHAAPQYDKRNDSGVIELTFSLKAGTTLRGDGRITLFNKKKYLPVIITLSSDDLKVQKYLKSGYEDKLQFTLKKDGSSGLVNFKLDKIEKYSRATYIQDTNHNIIGNEDFININGKLFPINNGVFGVGDYVIKVSFPKTMIYEDALYKVSSVGALNYNKDAIEFRIIKPKTDYEKRTSQYIEAIEHEDNNELSLAEAEIKSILKKWPDEKSFNYVLGRMKYKQGRYKECNEALEKVRPGDMENYFLTIDLGAACFIAEGKFEEAKSKLKDYYKDDKIADDKYKKIMEYETKKKDDKPGKSRARKHD